ncbi:MAG: membrane protein insertion efficiency factor YidD [Candidatus Omnitrophota bacterium]|nr:MAG: membrane protein insertion efficiency factor YidD [Candidatus Omnitrophota bacterium]
MLSKITIYCILFYQKYIRYQLPCSCRFTPSCSEYTRQALIKYGFFKGCLLGVLRLLRCHPFARQSGYDPIL